MLELLSPEHSAWQSAVALEVLHRLLIQPELLAWLSENFNESQNSESLTQKLVVKLKTYILKSFEAAAIDETLKEREPQSTFGQTGFMFNGGFVPLNENLSAKRWMM